ncbi:MAG: DNA/RNA nuclease SfsA [Clostridia bacterium]|nr:DNA/RNA nuclease SfsA [Clostridia bacterium]
MTYPTAVIPARFIARPNRFIATVDINGVPTTVHVKNTGRCRELLIPGATVYLAASANPTRKTPYDLIAVDKVLADGHKETVNMDSQAANDVAAEWLPVSGLFPTDAAIRREVTHGDSRFDFCISNADGQGATAYLEVKGCTLERDGVALFPDAPTERGVKHIRELINLAEQGIAAYILFVIQMKGTHTFRPNDATHKAFGDALREAHEAGVHILAVDCHVSPDTVTVDGYIPVNL